MGEWQLTRRAALTALTLAAASAAVKASAAPLGDVRFREIRVDVSPLRAKDESDEAQWVAAVLPGYLKQTFAKYLAPGDRSAGVLVARIDDVAVGSYPLYSSLGADSLQNSPYQTDILRRRVETLALSFAQWLPGKMGL